jgi:hypothetical protein
MGFCTASDGVHIAYASSGKGPPLVIMIGWVTHLERGFLSPAYFGDALRGFGAHHLVVRYDTRGFGLSDRGMTDYSLDARVRDLDNCQADRNARSHLRGARGSRRRHRMVARGGDSARFGFRPSLDPG